MTNELITTVPYNDLSIKDIVLSGGNNDYLSTVDPDVNLTKNCLARNCKYYNILDFNSTIGPNINSQLSMIVTNIRSATKNLDKFVHYIHNLSIKWTFIKVTETWGKSHNIMDLNIPGYKHVYYIRPRKTGGGCSLYIDENVMYKVRKDLQLSESVFIELDKNVFKYAHNVILGVIYRPPNTSLQEFNISLEHVLQCIDKERKILIQSGDYNVDTNNEIAAHSVPIQDFINVYASYNYHKLIDEPTRIIMEDDRIKSSTLIDNIYTNAYNWDSTISGILHSEITDHKSIFSIWPNTKCPKGPAYRTQRNLSKKNISHLKKAIKNNNWDLLYNMYDTSAACKYFFSFVTNMFYIMCPEERVKVTYHNRYPWIGEEIRKAITIREKLLHTKIRNPTQPNTSTYNTCRNKVISLQRKAEQEYYKEQLDLNKTDLRKSWKIITGIIGREGRNSKTKQFEFVINDKTITDPVQIANHFNNYFVSVGVTLASNCQPCCTDPLSYVVHNENMLSVPV